MSTQLNHPVRPDEIPSAPGKSSRWRWLPIALPWASLAARIVGAGVFGYAGIAKIGDPAGGVRAVRAYRILPESLVHPVAYGLPAFEVVLAALLLFGVASRVVGAIGAGLLAVFIGSVASAGLRGLRIDCGCFGGGGQVEHTHYLLEIGRDSLLLLLMLAIVFAIMVVLTRLLLLARIRLAFALMIVARHEGLLLHRDEAGLLPEV